MQYIINDIGFETYHTSSFKHELEKGFPLWAFLITLTPHKINEGAEIKEVPSGTCIIYPPNHPRYLYCADGADGLCNTWIHFTCFDQEGFYKKLKAYNLPVGRCFRLRQTEPVLNTMHDLVYEFSVQPTHSREMISLMIDTLFVHLSRNCMLRETSTNEIALRHLHSFEELRKRLYAVPEQDWAVKEMADRVFLSQNQFIKLYRNFFHTTPKQDLINARIQKAKSSLSTHSTIKEVALSVGFKNEFYFSNAFHQKTGLTPSSYAKINTQVLLYSHAQQELEKARAQADDKPEFPAEM